MSKYSLLKCYAIGYNNHSDDNHFYIHAVADNKDYSLAINVRSSKPVTDMYYALKEPSSEVTEMLQKYFLLPDGIYKKDLYPDYFLDYTTRPLSLDVTLTECIDTPSDMVSLEEQMLLLTHRSMKSSSAYLLTFGHLWGPKPHEQDYTFHFLPGQGIHDIHMNQNSIPGSRWVEKDRPGEDGALFFVFPDEKKIYAFYAAFNRKNS